MIRVLFLSIVVFFTVLQLQAQNWGGIKGEGDVVKQEIQLSGIKGFNLGIAGDVVLSPNAAYDQSMKNQAA